MPKLKGVDFNGCGDTEIYCQQQASVSLSVRFIRPKNIINVRRGK
jgi:hypothetical protein